MKIPDTRIGMIIVGVVTAGPVCGGWDVPERVSGLLASEYR